MYFFYNIHFQGYDISTLKLSDNFKDDEPYGFLLRMAKEEAALWSFLKTCYKQKREDIKAQNVNL